ncbi:hypothetical protein D3C81_903860 [compost metagenome]
MQAHEQEQRGSGNGGGVGNAHADGIHQVFLHVRGVGVERQGTAHGQADHGHQFLGVTHQGAHRAFLGFFFLGERLGLFHAATQVQRHHGTQRADGERDAPAPGVELLGGQEVLQDNQHRQSDELAGDQGHVLEAGVEAATLLGRHLAEVSGGGAVFATHRQALQQAREHQQDRRADADDFITRAQGDQQRAEAHQVHRGHQGLFAPDLVGIQTHQPAADRAHQEAHGEDRGGVEQLGGGVAFGEEGLGEVQGEGGVDVPVVPLDHVANGTAEDRLDAAGSGSFFGRRGSRPKRQGVGVIH